MGDNMILHPLATISIGSKWEVDEAKLRALKSNIDLELFETYLEDPKDRWAVVSPRDPFSANDLDTTPAEFTCSKGTRVEVNPVAQRLERDTQLMFSHPTQITTRLYLKQRETSWHTERRIAARVAEHLLVVTAQGHTKEFA